MNDISYQNDEKVCSVRSAKLRHCLGANTIWLLCLSCFPCVPIATCIIYIYIYKKNKQKTTTTKKQKKKKQKKKKQKKKKRCD